MERVSTNPDDASGDADIDRSVDEILDRLRHDGGRATTGRRAIIRALLTASDHHVTAEDLTAAVQVEHPQMHLTTVYRTLEALEEIGLVDRIALGAVSGAGSVYHLRAHAHDHLVCVSCGAVVELPADLVAPVSVEIQGRFGFAAAGQRMVVSGRCATCCA